MVLRNRERRRLTWAILPVLAALAGAPGCVQRPTITLHSAEVRGISTNGVNVLIFLQIRNDNSYDVQVRHVNCNVVMGRGYVLGPVDFTPNQWLPSNQTTFLAVPVTIPWTLVPSLATETFGSYTIQYQVKGSADVTATRAFGIERDNYPIDHAGFVPRQMVMDAARTVLPLPY
jgi:hypothetical protein